MVASFQPPRPQPGDGQVPPARNPTQPSEASSVPGLTGKTRYRLGWRGRLVLQVEYRAHRYVSRYAVPSPWAMGLARYWRDATVEDLQALYQDDHEVGPDGHR